MKNSNKLLIDENPLVLLPNLAKEIGLNQAVILQQIHYWLTIIQRKKDISHFLEDRWWVYNSYKEWQDDNFPFWSVSTIQRIMLDLEKSGLILATQPHKDKWDHTKWYTIDYDALERKIDHSNLTLSDASDCGDPSSQVDTILIESETATETTTETIFEDKSFIPETSIIYPVQPERIISTWDLRKNEKVKNPSAKKALDQGLSKPEVEKTKFWWLSEYSRPLMDAFVVASGVEPIKGDYKMWAKEAENWYLHHLTVSDIVQAIKQLRAKNYTVGQPKAVTVTAIAIHCNPTGEQQGTLDSLERAGFTYGGS